MTNNTGFWIVISIGVIGGAGYWYYKTKIEKTKVAQATKWWLNF